MATAPTTPTELVRFEGALAEAARDDSGWSRAPGMLSDLEEVLRALSAGWEELAARAAPTVVRLRDHAPLRVGDGETGLSREQEVRLISALHDLATALGASARACREARAVTTPLIERRLRAARRHPVL